MNQKPFKAIFHNVGAPIISVTVFLAIWQLAVMLTQLGKVLPNPPQVLIAFFNSFTHNIGGCTIVQHTLFSLSRVFIAYSVASLSGITLGILMGRVRLIEAIFRPFYEVLRPVPPIAWIPLAILWFGLGEMTKYFIIFVSAFVNVTYNCFSGSRTVDPHIIGVSKMLGANDFQVFVTVVIPASVPYIFSGLQMALGAAWAAVVAAEMVRSSDGVGWIIVSGMDVNNMVQILVGILVIGLMGFLLATILRKIESVLCAWNAGGV